MKTEVANSILSCESTGTTLQAKLRFAADLPIFAGHFPGHPIVPGIYLIEAARQLVERCGDGSLRINSVLDARFSAEIHPDIPVDVTGSFQNELWDLRFSIPTGPAARVRLRVSPT